MFKNISFYAINGFFIFLYLLTTYMRHQKGVSKVKAMSLGIYFIAHSCSFLSNELVTDVVGCFILLVAPIKMTISKVEKWKKTHKVLSDQCLLGPNLIIR